jgi:hypothetical protein
MAARASLWAGAITGLLLGGCAANDPVVSTTLNTAPAGNWQTEKQLDRITGATISSSTLAAKSSHTRKPFQKNAVLQLLCFRDKPIVRFGFEVTIGSTRNSDLGHRFDENPDMNRARVSCRTTRPR